MSKFFPLFIFMYIGPIFKILQMSEVNYQCTNCNTTFKSVELLSLCPNCVKLDTNQLPPKGTLQIIYPQSGGIAPSVQKQITSVLQHNMPFSVSENLEKLIPFTPLTFVSSINAQHLHFNLFIKDETLNQTLSVTNRAAKMAFSSPEFFGNGILVSKNAMACSIAYQAALHNKQAILLAPATLSLSKYSQALVYGSTLITVNGLYHQIESLVYSASSDFGLINFSEGYNPLYLEGYKIISYELVHQLQGIAPDFVFIPVGNAVLLAGIYKGFEEMLKLSVIPKMPVLVAVQPEINANFVYNIHNADFNLYKKTSLADDISIEIPSNYYMANLYMKQFQGQVVTLTEKEIEVAVNTLANTSGMFCSPSGSIGFAALKKFIDFQYIRNNSNVVVLATTHGMRDINSLHFHHKIEAPINPDLNHLKQRINFIL